MPNFSLFLPLQLQLLNLIDTSGAAKSVADTTGAWEASRVAQAATAATEPKFWLIEDLWQLLHRSGVGPKFADLLAFIAACAIILAIVWLVDRVVTQLLLAAVKRYSKRSKTTIDDRLVEHHFFHRLFHLIPLLIILMSAKVLFTGFNVGLIVAVKTITGALIVFVVLLVCFSLLNAFNASYQEKNQNSTRKSIKGYTQVAKIMLSFIAAILIISMLLDKDPSNLLAGLGAAAALLSLVFKDTILGFVASIQLSVQDMVRPGDWIEMPSKNADGVVLDINVNSVKVQNWDNTVTMIPIYSMVSDAFTNWRGMENSQGRRFVRYININLDCIKIVTAEQLESLGSDLTVGPAMDKTLALAHESSGKGTLTNVALFRAFIELFLRNHPKINHDLLIFVRYKGDSTEKGLLVEIYAFSTEKEAEKYDVVHRSVIEYVVATAPLFGIRLFQAPSGDDFRSMNKTER